MTSLMFRPTTTATYAWVIDKDLLAEPGDTDSEVGVTGPSTAPTSLLDQLTQQPGVGVKFKMFDDDGEHYYTGRILRHGEDGSVIDTFDGDEEFFGPLQDFGMPNAGCTEIQYKVDGAWVGL